MTLRAHIQVHISSICRARFKGIPTATSYRDLVVGRVDVFFHLNLIKYSTYERRASLLYAGSRCKAVSKTQVIPNTVYSGFDS